MHWLGDPASLQGVAMRTDWYVFMIAATAVGVFVYACIGWCLLAYRARPGRTPARFEGNPPLEILYAVLPLVLVVGLFGVTYAVEMPIDHVFAATAPQIVPVEVVAFRWSWRFHYRGTGIVITGTPMQPPTLYLPVGRTAEIDLRTADVNHSFWVPAFLFKRDAIPGMTNVFDVTPRRVGSYLSRCAQFCGLEHALMTFTVKVVPDADYDRFVASGGVRRP